MKRSYAGGLAAALLVVIAGAWFVTQYERVETRVWVGPSGAARANPYLAAMRFLDRIGFRTELTERPTAIDNPPAGATVVLLAGRASLTPARIDALHRWVAGGGHLVIQPEPLHRRDPLLDSIPIGRVPTKAAKTVHPARMQFPGMEQPLRVTAIGGMALDAQGARPDVVVADDQGTQLVSMRRGHGRLTVASGMQRFENARIGEHDNAELLRRTLGLGAADGQVILVRAPQGLPVWTWLRQHALGSMIAAGVLLALWLWHIAPRFGPIAITNESPRKQLLAHILACGRFRWAQGARLGLLAAARDRCLRHIAALEPRLAHLPKEHRYRELSSHLGTQAVTLERAFEAVPQSPREFVHMVGTLASIHAGVSRAKQTRGQRRKTT